jgi:hypothetical protein
MHAFQVLQLRDGKEGKKAERSRDLRPLAARVKAKMELGTCEEGDCGHDGDEGLHQHPRCNEAEGENDDVVRKAQAVDRHQSVGDAGHNHHRQQSVERWPDGCHGGLGCHGGETTVPAMLWSASHLSCEGHARIKEPEPLPMGAWLTVARQLGSMLACAGCQGSWSARG